MIKITLTEEEVLEKSPQQVFDIVNDKMERQRAEYEKVQSTIPSQKEIEKILAKLRRPCHRDLISRNLKLNEQQTSNLINYLLDRDFIQEYNPDLAKGFYVVKKNKN